MEWQPIETAPTNDVYIMIFCKGAETPAIAKFEHETDKWTAIGGDTFNNPIYWMPLPEAPNVKLRGSPASGRVPLERRVRSLRHSHRRTFDA